MALNSSGPISLAGSTTGQSIAVELGQSASGQISLNDTNVRTLAGVPSGAITMPTNFWGKSSVSYWINTLVDSSADTQAYETAFDSSGNVYVVGYSNDAATNYARGLLVKFNSSGALQWQKLLTGTNYLYFYNLAIDSSNNIYVTGYGQIASIYYIVIVKYNSSGALLWQRSLGPVYNSSPPNGIALDSSGNVYIAASSQSGAINRAVVAKYDSSGTIQWQRELYSLSGSTPPYGLRICVDSSGNSYVGGRIYNSEWNLLVLKYNSSGVIQWQREITSGSSTSDLTASIAIDSSSNLYIVGWTDGPTANDGFVVKVDSGGTFQWARSFRDQIYNQGINFNGVATDSSSNIYATGFSSANGTSRDVQLVKYDGSGNVLWQRILYTSGFEDGFGIKISPANVISVSGRRIGTYFQTLDFLVPTDGSKTGTYSSWTYAASSSTNINTGTWSGTAATLSEIPAPYTSASSSFTDSSGSLTLTSVSIP
jgi:Beta-propeller repeat